MKAFELVNTAQKGVAVSARKAPNIARGRSDPGVEQATGAAVGVTEEDAPVEWLIAQAFLDRRNDPIGPVVQRRGQVVDLDGIREFVDLQHGPQLTGESPAGEHERTGHLTEGPGGSGVPRRVSTSCLAISAATPASRQ